MSIDRVAKQLSMAVRLVNPNAVTKPATDTGAEVTAVVEDRQHVIQTGIRPAFAETFRLLAIHIQRLADTQQLQSLIVMGAYPADGRTTIVANLGIALANLGKRVVLVEADSRRSSLSRLFGVEPQRSDRAPGLIRSSHFLIRTSIDGVDVAIPSLRPGEQYRGDPFGEMIASLSLDSDFILVDSAPCMYSAVPFRLAPMVDGVIYVIRRRQQDVSAQRNIQSHLARLGANVLGVVYNEGK